MTNIMSDNEKKIIENNKIGELLALIDAKSRKDVDVWCNRDGMVPLEVVFLKKLYMFDNKEISLKEIERILHVTQSDVTRISRKLEEKELIEKFADPTDYRKRRVIMRLTDKGCDYAKTYFEKLKIMNDILLDGISEEEEKILRNLLIRIYYNIKDIEPLKDL